MSPTQPFDAVRHGCRQASNSLQVQSHPERLEAHLQDETAYSSAVQRAAAPRLPLSFPSLAHEINFLCVMALLDTPAYAAQYAAKSSATDDAWSDVVLRGCMAAYISSTTDEFSSRANLLGAKGMKWPAKKLAELFNLSLSEMHETDHPTMPAVKVGERREGRHAAVVRAMAECLSAASRRLEQAGYESAGEVVLRGFEAAREQGEVGGASVVAQLLDVLPELGEAYEIGGITISLHSPLIRLSNNILALLQRSKDEAAAGLQLALPATIDLEVARKACQIGLVDVTQSSDKRVRAIASATGSLADTAEDAVAVAYLRAAVVAACEEAAAWGHSHSAQAAWRKDVTPFGIGALLAGLLAQAAQDGIDL